MSRSTGYVSGAASQPDSAVAAIRLSGGPVPAALIIGAIAVMSAYPLTEEKFREIVHEVAERRATRRVQEAR